MFRVENGVLVCDSRRRPDHDYVLLVNDRHTSDFELRMNVRADGSLPGNSGVQVRGRSDRGAH